MLGAAISLPSSAYVQEWYGHRRLASPALGLLGAQLGTAVPADVEERPQQPVPAAHEQHALAADLDLLELPGSARSARGPHRTTCLEDALLLRGEDVSVGVVIARPGCE